MDLTLIGKKASNIEDVILKTRDDVKVTKFRSIEEFILETQSRHPVIDRIILMQDAYVNLQNMDFILSSFCEFILKNYPSTRLVTLSNTDMYIDTLANIFISPIYAHVYLDRAKPSILISLATEPIEDVKKKYEKIVASSNIETIGEIIDDGVEEQEQTQAQQKNGGKQKKGLFGGLFGKKGKGKKGDNTQDVAYAPIGQGVGVDEFSATEGQQDTYVNVKYKSNENYGYGEEYTEEYSDDNYSDYSDEYADFNSQESEDSGLNVDFELQSTVIGEDEGWGDDYSELVSDETTSTETESYEESTYQEDDWSDSVSDTDNVDTEGYYDDEHSNHDDYLGDYADTEDYVDDTEDYSDVSEESNLDVRFEDSDNDSTETLEYVNYDDIASKKLIDLTREHIEAGKSIEVKKLDIPTKQINIPKVKTEEVDTLDGDIFGDLSDLEKQYEDANVKTVVKEKVVERVVEVNKGGVNTRNYKNGVRLIVVTGDRKTGVTRTALNLASIYAKHDDVLYVDFDVENHGSVAYIGIEDLVTAPDNMQNGIKNISHERMLQNLTFFSNELKINCLTSIYGADVDDEQIDVAQSVVAHQTTFTTVIVDCPLHKLFLLEDILVYSEVLICVEPYVNTVINTVTTLSSMDDIKLSALLSRHCSYVLTKGKVEELNESLSYVSDIFSLENKPVNWTKIPFAGKVKELGAIAERLW